VTALGSGNPRDIAAAIRPITETLVGATPLIFAGLAIAISFRAGMFNIGGDGQLMIGALGATITVLALSGQAPPLLILLAGLAVGALSGGMWGFIPGFLKARTGAHEVITTIMLNYVAVQVVFFALRSTFLRAPGSTSPVSRNLTPITDVPLLITLPGIRLDLGFIVALVMAAIVSWLLFRTTLGFELRAAGFNLTAARYAGMSAGGSMILAMALSGGLLGLGGSFMVLGTVGARQPATQRCRARGAAVRGTHDRREADGHPVRHPVRSAVVHHGPRHHVRGRARPDPVDLAGAGQQAGA
jgi:simple sugar transport system permease protein